MVRTYRIVFTSTLINFGTTGIKWLWN